MLNSKLYTAVATFSCDSRQAFLLSTSNLTRSYSDTPTSPVGEAMTGTINVHETKWH